MTDDEISLQEFGESYDTHTVNMDGVKPFDIKAITNEEYEKIQKRSKDLSEDEEVSYIVELVEEYVLEDVDVGKWGLMKTMRVWLAMQEAWEEDDDIKQAMKQVETPGNRQRSRQRPNKR